MLKTLVGLALCGALFADTAMACRPCGAPAQEPAAAATQQAAPASQAQRSQSARRYSYEPSMQTYNRMNRRSYGSWSSHGIRRASSKILGNY